MEPMPTTRGYARFAALADRAVMFCGAQHGTLDRYALMIFPLMFFLFTVTYWTVYLNEAHAAANKRTVI